MVVHDGNGDGNHGLGDSGSHGSSVGIADDPTRTAERWAGVGGLAGAVVGARDGPVSAGLGAVLGGSTAYAVGYVLSQRTGACDGRRKPMLDEYLGDDGGPFGIDVESVGDEKDGCDETGDGE